MSTGVIIPSVGKAKINIQHIQIHHNMTQSIISKINGVDIVTVDKDGDIYVPIRPICQALGIDLAAQTRHIKRHYILASTVATVATVAADDKEREMLCLPVEYIYGWLFTIDAGQVAEARRESVAAYQLECYKALYEHFAGSLRRRVEENEAEIGLLREINAAIGEEKEAKARRRKAEEALDKLRSERLNPQPRLIF